MGQADGKLKVILIIVGVVLALLVVLAIIGLAVGLGVGLTRDSDSDDSGSTDNTDVGPSPSASPGPVVLTPVTTTQFRYALSQSTSDIQVWTTASGTKVSNTDIPPDSSNGSDASEILIYAAKQEYEPFVIVVHSSDDQILTYSPFPNLGTNSTFIIRQALYDPTDNVIDKLSDPIENGTSLTLQTSPGTVLWGSVFVPSDAPAGNYTAYVNIGPLSIPIFLHVFNFSIPPNPSYKSLMYWGWDSNSPEQDQKDAVFAYRHTPTTTTWPSGFSYGITWENTDANNVDANGTSNYCINFDDEPYESAPYSIRNLSKKYILGEGWNGVGFSINIAFQFVDNETPRPSTFCGQSLGTVGSSGQEGTPSYNAAWSTYLTQLNNYLIANNYLSKSYYYVQNEPQGPSDYDLAVSLCGLTRAAAPGLKIAVSEEPKPEISERCPYDIYIASMPQYRRGYAWTRLAIPGTNETVWFYSLEADPEPYPNPTIISKGGEQVRLIPWISWVERAEGYAYYAVTTPTNGGWFYDYKTPTVRADLFREGFEDYEYLLLANSNQKPRVNVTETVDPTATSLVRSLTSWVRNYDSIMAAKIALGKYIAGETSSIPIIYTTSVNNVSSAVYINFQDPNGQPTTDPLVDDGKTYIKVGWEPYDPVKGYGWFGQFVGLPDEPGNVLLESFSDQGAPFTEVTESFIYDDYGRKDNFEYAMPNGQYNVTVTVGRPNRGNSDPNNVYVEGVKVVDEVVTTPDASLYTASTVINLTDGSITFEFAGQSVVTNDYAYTFINNVWIEPL